jgi:4-diphosphocytidyl-2C-methyl-D-erythritol kinase
MIGDLLGLAPQLRDANDLWAAAASLEPALPALRGALEQKSGVPWLMSGSGSTLFALYPSAAEAAEAGKALAASGLPELKSVLINAVDLVGPDPIWRHP